MTATTPRVDPDLVRALRADLVASGFTVDGVTELLGPVARGRPRPRAGRSRRSASRRPPTTPCATLVRLFTLGDPVDLAEARRGPADARREGAVALGLVAPEGDGVVARCDLRPYAADDARHWWLASDLGELATGRPLREDHVLGIGGASATLAAVDLRGRTSTAPSTSAPAAASRPCTLDAARRRRRRDRPVRARPGLRPLQRGPRRVRLGRALAARCSTRWPASASASS